MLNLLNAEWFKLRKSKAFLACLVSVVISVIFTYGMLSMVNEIQTGGMQNGTGGVVVTADADFGTGSIWDSLEIIEIYQQIVVSFISMISVIFSAIFVIGEFGHGGIKNLVGKGYSRGQVFLAKYAISVFGTAIMTIVSATLTFAIGCFFMGTDTLNGTLIGEYVIFTLLQMGLLIALNSLVVTLSEISRNLGAGISIGIGIVGFSQLISSALDLMFRDFNFKASDYWILDLMGNCPLADFGAEIVWNIVFVVVLWSGIAIVGGMLHFGKADIK